MWLCQYLTSCVVVFVIVTVSHAGGYCVCHCDGISRHVLLCLSL